MNRTQYISKFPAFTPASRGMGADDRDPAEIAAEVRARRAVNTVATLRILVPVALITAIVLSARPVPEAPIASVVAPVTVTPTADAATQYFPAQYLNQGLGGEEHVQNF